MAAARREAEAFRGDRRFVCGGRQFHAGTEPEGSRDLSRGGRDARDVRHGRCAKLRHVRCDHGAQRKLLSLHELRIDERVQLV